MSLLKKAQEAAGDAGQEGAEGTAAVETAAAETTQAAAPAAPAPSQVAANAVAMHNAKAALAVNSKVNIHVIAQLKDALPVDFNTLAQVQANQGKFRDKETEKNLGETIEIELLSWQDSFVVGPNDTKAPKELVKYSDDGKVAKDGTDMLQHLEMLKRDGYTKAKLQQRCVLVGALLAAEKDQNLVGQLIQIDLSPQSRAMFMRYNANAAWLLKSGKLDEDTVKTLVLTAAAAKGPDNTDYTKVEFKAKALA